MIIGKILLAILIHPCLSPKCLIALSENIIEAINIITLMILHAISKYLTEVIC